MTISGFVRRVLSYIDRHGLSHTVRRAWEKACDRIFLRYERLWRATRTTEEVLQYMRRTPIHDGVGLFSILVPVYNTEPSFLRALAESFRAQTYPVWEACLYDGMSTRPETIAVLDELAQADSRFKVVHGTANDGISGNTNHALEMATGEWIALCDHDDLYEPDALYRMAEYIRNLQPDMLYSDEDFIDASGKVHTSPHFKPDFCPDTLRSGNYICHLMVMRRSLLKSIGGFRPETDGSQDHDVALRISEKTDKIVHVPHVLYHWRQFGGSMSHQQLERCLNAGARAVEEHIARIGYPGKVTHKNAQLRIAYDIDRTASVRLVILHDQADGDVKRSPALTGGMPDRAVVTDVRKYTGSPWHALNEAAQAAQEDYIVFMSSRIAMQGNSWLDELQMYAQRSDVGAAGAMIVNLRGRVVHAGFAVRMEGLAQCRSLNVAAKNGGWHGILNTTHNVEALGLGCVMVRRETLQENPVNDAYEEGLCMVDWSLRLGVKKLRHVLVPFATGVCGNRAFADKYLLTGKSRHDDDRKRCSSRWVNATDHCYSERFNRQKANYTARL